MIPQVTITDSRSVYVRSLGAPFVDYYCTAVISISDVGSDVPSRVQLFTGRKLILHFDDVDNSDYGYTPVLSGQIDAVVRFARETKDDDRVLVHCGAGISRSTACALAISMVRYTPCDYNADKILKWLLGVRPNAKPNLHVLGMIGRATGWNDILVDLCASKIRY